MQVRMRVLLMALSPLLFAADAREICPLSDVPMRSPREAQQAAWRAASSNAELVAGVSAVSGGRQRSVATPAQSLPIVNFVDADLFAAMKAANITPTALSSDAEFLRRVSLDLNGQIPDATAVVAFLNDRSPDKRTKKIDELLASDAFNDRWTMWFGDLVENVRASTNSREYYLGRNAYYSWIRSSIAASKPYDTMVRELVAGSGSNFTSGAANFWVRQIQPNGPIQDTWDNLAADTGEKFLGLPLLCLSCHSGPGHLELVNQGLKTRQRSEFWGMAAFFSRGRAPGTRYTDPANPNANVITFTVQDGPAGSYLLNTTSGNKTPRQPAAGQSAAVQPAYMFTGEGPRPGESWREAYGRILTSDRQFARAAVNYLWKEMFGIGIVEPVNAFDLARLDPKNLPKGSTLQPANAQLLEDLTTEFIASKYDLRSILRTMAVSSAYQLSSVYTPGAWNESWTPYFARHYPHRLMAEEILDAVVKATNVPQPLNVQGLGSVARAMQLPDTTEPGPRTIAGGFLDEFGRGNRDDASRRNDGSIAQALAMMNHTIVTSKVKRGATNSTVGKVLASTTDPAAITDQLYLATLSRYPSTKEKATAIDYLKSGNLQSRTEDLQFALMNQLEFLFD